MLPIAYFDAHCDTLSCCAHLGWDLGETPGHADLARGGAFAHYAQVFAIFHDATKAPPDGMYAEFLRQAAVFDAQMEAHGDRAAQCRNETDLRRAREAGKCAALLSVEGADLLDCDPEKIEEAARRGVKLINLTWNRANALSGSNAEEPARGLSPLGKDFVGRARAAGILIDVSHLSDAGFWDLAELDAGPIVASHSDSRALCAHRRNLTDAMFDAVRRSGGFVGLNFYTPFLGLDGSIDAVFAHLEHFLERGGEKTVGFGGDWDGCDSLPRGIGGIQDMEKIYERMLQRNYPEALIGDIFYNNLGRTILCHK